MFNHQKKALEVLSKNKALGLFLPMGSGKTFTMLSLIELYKWSYNITWLIIAPPLVAANVWDSEIKKHGFNLTYIKITSKTVPSKRIKLIDGGLYDILILSDSLLKWASDNGVLNNRFNGCIIDEIGRMRASDSVKFKILKKLRPRFDFFYGLTGTPAPNGLFSLYGIIRLISDTRYFKYLKDWEELFYYRVNPAGYKYAFSPKPGTENFIEGIVKAISFSCEPSFNVPILTSYVHITPDSKFMKSYNIFLRDRVIELGDMEATAASVSSVLFKCVQYSAGFMYGVDGRVLRFNTLKLDALKGVLEECEGENVLICYWFKEDKELILREIVGSEVLDIDKWNSGQQKIALAHPASCGHGVNLQSGGNILIWYTLTFDLELYLQMRKRLARPGQEKTVIEKIICIDDTVDKVIIDRLDKKDKIQDGLVNAIINHVKGRC